MNQLVVRESIPNDHEMMVYQTMAKQAVESKMYRGIGEQAGVMMIMLAARELGIPAMQALNGGINIIQGKVEISARMMSALIRRAGHQMKIVESTDSICRLMGKRCDTGETETVSFSLADAQKAGLVKQGGGWMKFPKDMCFARALSRLARQLFSDVIGIGYVEGEIKPSDAEIVLPEVMPESIEPEENIALLMDKYFTSFDEENRAVNAEEYLTAVEQHFNWDRKTALKELVKDLPKLKEKFEKWMKTKNKEQSLCNS
jgi:hypothetical protein